MPIFPVQPWRISRQGVANTALTVSSPEPVSAERRTLLRGVYVPYSANVNVDITVTLNSGAGSAFDIRLATITLVAQRWGIYVPDAPMPLSVGDTIDVVAPAGGAGVTATIQILIDQEHPVASGEGGYQVEQGRRV